MTDDLTFYLQSIEDSDATHPNANIIAALKEMLDGARRGDVTSIAMAFEHKQGGSQCFARHGVGSRPATLLVEVAIMLNRMALEITDEQVDDGDNE